MKHRKGSFLWKNSRHRRRGRVPARRLLQGVSITGLAAAGTMFAQVGKDGRPKTSGFVSLGHIHGSATEHILRGRDWKRDYAEDRGVFGNISGAVINRREVEHVGVYMTVPGLVCSSCSFVKFRRRSTHFTHNINICHSFQPSSELR